MDKIVEMVDVKTGEVKEVLRPVIPFRTLLTASEYQDMEKYEPGTSCVDLTGYEPLDSIVARCMRTMRSPSGATTQVLDLDALRAEAQDTGIYEAKDAHTVDEAFDTLDPTDSPGFDFSDASQVLKSVNDNLSQAKDLPTTELSRASNKAQANVSAVDKSELQPDLEEKQTA